LQSGPKHLLHAAIAVALLSLGCGNASANESFGSEFSHFVAGGVMAGAATAIADHYGVEQRGWVGFWTSVGLSFVSEGLQVAANGSSQAKGSALDFGSNMLGAALGAWVTDQYILSPVVARDASGHYTVGVAMRLPF
jgi:hypothetical protein